MALQHAIGLAGQVTDEAVRRLNLIDPLYEVREGHRQTEQGITAALRTPT